MVSKIYVDLLSTLKEKIRRARSLAVLTVNSQMLSVYWEIGEVIDKLSKEGGYGSKTIEKMAADLRSEFPDMEGLGVRSLRYMREFHKAYPEFIK